MMKIKALFLSALLLTLSVATASAMELGSGNNVEIHGFITQGYIGSTDNNFFGDTSAKAGSFQFNERGVNFSSDVSDRLHMGIQLFSRDFGSSGNNKVTVDWAYADYSIVEAFNLRAGKVKINYGFYNTGRDVDMLRNSVLLPQSVYNEGWRDSVNALNGMEAYGYLYAGGAGSFEYHVQGGVVNFADGGGELRLLEDQAAHWMDMDVKNLDTKYTAAAAFTWETPVDGFRVGASGWKLDFDAPMSMNAQPFDVRPITDVRPIETPILPGHPDYDKSWKSGRTDTTFDVTLTSWATSLEYVIGDLVFAAEYTRVNYELRTKNNIINQEFESEGYYAGLTYRFSDWFELGTYYSEYYPDKDDKEGAVRANTWKNGSTKLPIGMGFAGGYPPGQEHRAYLKDLALTLRFDITENWIFKMEGHKMEGSAMMLNSDGNTGKHQLAPDVFVNGPDYEKDWYLYTAKVAYSF